MQMVSWSTIEVFNLQYPGARFLAYRALRIGRRELSIAELNS